MSEPVVKLYATSWCYDCRRVKRFLSEYAIPFDWIDIDRDKQAEQYVLQVNHGMRSVPTLLFADGTILTEPSDTQLSAKFNSTPTSPSAQ